jgi:hypothetical protein
VSRTYTYISGADTYDNFLPGAVVQIALAAGLAITRGASHD